MLGKIAASIRNLFSIGIPVVCAAGNSGSTEGRAKEVDSYPALFKGQNGNANLLVTSAVDEQGNIPDFAQTGPLVDLYAPGLNVPVFDLYGDLFGTQGTSISVSTLALNLHLAAIMITL